MHHFTILFKSCLIVSAPLDFQHLLFDIKTDFFQIKIIICHASSEFVLQCVVSITCTFCYHCEKSVLHTCYFSFNSHVCFYIPLMTWFRACMLFSFFMIVVGFDSLSDSCLGDLFVVHISKLHFLIKYDPCFTVTIWKKCYSIYVYCVLTKYVVQCY